MSRVLILAGAVLIVIGLLWPLLGKLGLGRLPGDMAFQRGGVSFYFPVVTCLVLSILATIVLWLFRL